MTSLESSAKSKNYNPFWVNLKNSIKDNLSFPMQIVIFLGLMYPLSAWENISAHLNSEISSAVGKEVYNIANEFRYIIASTETIYNFAFLISFDLLFMGIMLGIAKFRFMFKKNSVNVYFSLGITRTKLFVSTYLAGALQLLLSIITPMAVVFFINLKYFKFSKELFLSILFLIIGYFAIALFGFTVSSIVASAVGTMAETFIFSSLFVLLPNIVFGCIQQLMSLFVLGNEYDLNHSSLRYVYDFPMPSLFEKYRYLIPGNFFINDIALYHILDKKDSSIGSVSYLKEVSNTKWVTPNFMLPIGWIIVSLIGFALGVYILNKCRTETAGFIGSSKTMNFISTFIICFSAFCLSTAVFTEFSTLLVSTLISAIAFIIIYFIMELILTRKIKFVVKGIRKLPVHLGVTFAICLIFSTGLFGYSTKTPNIADIKKVSVNVPIGNSAGLNTHSDSYNNEISLRGYGNVLESITSKEDLEVITGIHKQFIADGRLNLIKDKEITSDDDVIDCAFYIKYTLKNGKTLTRYYNKTKVSTLVKTLDIEKTQKYEEQIDAIFTKPISKKDSEQVVALKTIIQSDNSSIYMLSNHLDIKEPVTLDKNKRLEFLDCIAKDIKNQTVFERNLPNTQLIGVIMFMNNEISYKDEGYEKNFGFEENKVVEPQDIDLNSISFSPYNRDKFFVQVTQDMKNTVKFIEDNALLQNFDNSSKIVSAQIIDKKILLELYPWLSSNSYVFTGGKITNNYNDHPEENYSSFKNSYTTKDVSTITQLELNSYHHYFAVANTYFVRYNLDDGSKVFMLVPENKLPKHIKDGVAKIKLKDINSN